MRKFTICILLMVFCQIAWGGTVAHWTFDEGSGPATANIDGDPNLALQLGVHLTNPRQDPAWTTSNGITCLDFDNQNMSGKTVFCKHVAGTWGNEQFASLIPSGGYTYEMIFNLQSTPPGWSDDGPWTFMALVDETNAAWYYYLRFSKTYAVQFSVDSTHKAELNTAGTENELAPGRWYYISAIYDPAAEPNDFVLTLKDLDADIESQVGFDEWPAFSAWPSNGEGAFVLGGNVYTSASYSSRSSNMLISEARITDGVVAPEDRLSQNWPLLVEGYQWYADDTELQAEWVTSGGAIATLSTGDYYLSPKGMVYEYVGDSLVTKTYAEDQDWSRNGLKVIDVPFYGIEGNSTAETLYVMVEDADGLTASVDYPDSTMLADKGWEVWHVSMSDLAGIDLSRVRKISIGLAGGIVPGSGTIYIDDIRIHPCRAQQNSDLNQDCIVDTADFAQMAQDWLAEGLH